MQIWIEVQLCLVKNYQQTWMGDWSVESGVSDHPSQNQIQPRDRRKPKRKESFLLLRTHYGLGKGR